MAACFVALATAFLLTVIGGCTKPEEIREYAVANNPPPQPTHRMLAAIVPDEQLSGTEKVDEEKPGPRAWFFKLVGPISQMETVNSAFDQFVASVRIGSGDLPKWELPEAWVEDPAGRSPEFNRATTIRIGKGESRLELAVSKLPMPRERREGWLVGNVNRWRAQMQLPAIARSELDEYTQKIKAGEGSAIKVDFRGVFSAAPMAGMAAKTARAQPNTPTAKESSKRTASNAGESAKSSPASLPFDVNIPPDWKPGRTSGGMRVAAYVIEADGGRPGAEVTVTPLGPAAGDLKANVDRWRQEIKLAASKPEELEEQTKSIEIDGQKADFVHLVGPQDARPREATLGVILRQPDRVWFFKLRGEAEIVEREKEHFEEFVKSVKFKS